MSTSSTGQQGTDPGSYPRHPYVTRHFVVAGEELRHASGWLLFLGIVLIVLGFLALMLPLFATLSLIILYGWLLVFAGLTQAVAAFASLRWGGFFLHMLIGILDFVVGLFFFRVPGEAAAILTLLLAAAFLVGGVFRLIAALSLRFPNWGWTVLSGVVTFAVGLVLWAGWPWNSLVVPGLFLGIQMLFYGWSAVMLASAARS
jgi:uncharacterized membrane protein HdeD (DUF308 family)